MTIGCPYCKAVINLKKVKPGRFNPKCPGCSNTFVIIVPNDPNGTISVQKSNPPKSSTSGPDTDRILTQPKAKPKASDSPAPAADDTVRIPPAKQALTLEERAALMLEGQDPGDMTETDTDAQITADPDSEAAENLAAPKPAPKPAPKKNPPRAGSSESAK
ncbi:MAG: hypothetical protein L0241_01030 [Planctomycetia bacterium]|nr:hypothetical protein [Planctomycetia bacterium]